MHLATWQISIGSVQCAVWLSETYLLTKLPAAESVLFERSRYDFIYASMFQVL